MRILIEKQSRSNKRIMLSIKNRDPERFNRGIKKIRLHRDESK